MTTDETPQARSLNFIVDQAAEVDTFGSHERLAEVMAGVLQGPSPPRVVGLFGAWGAGKSTVIRLLETALQRDSAFETYVFTFDAWRHQSDPPRRAFLEAFSKFLIDKDLSHAGAHTERLGRLSGEIAESELHVSSQIPPAGRWLLLSLLLTPLGMQFVGHDWYDATGEPNATLLERWAYTAGWLVLLTPLAIAIAAMVRGYVARKSSKIVDQAHSLLAIFLRHDPERRRERVLRAPEPTAIEFQSGLREMMREVSKSNRRFLFVVDNLDRLPSAEALALWGAVRSLFLGPADEASHTIILPIDDLAVANLFAAQGGRGGGRRRPVLFREDV